MESRCSGLRVPDRTALAGLRGRPGVVHPRFGDLAGLAAVQMNNGCRSAPVRFSEDDNGMIYLTVTGRCYANCRGCINSAVTLADETPRNLMQIGQECDPERDAAIVSALASRMPDQITTVCFYGGEPFLAADRMADVCRILDGSKIGKKTRYMVYTNGELLTEALRRFPDLMKRMWLFSVSIDGDEAQHNRVRSGTRLSRIVENLRQIKDNVDGKVLFWSTLREEQSLLNCFHEFRSLYREGLTDYFFWHWAESRSAFEDFSAYAVRYGQDLERIMDVYVDELYRGVLLPIIHLNELVVYLATGKERGHSACAVELAKNYDIVAGRVCACADLPPSLSFGEMDPAKGLDLKDRDLSPLVAYKDWLGCFECGVHAYCGGRCPVQVIAGSRERTVQYCQLMRLHVGIVQERIGKILKGLDMRGISLQEVYDRSVFLTKYTDVVP